MRRLWMMGLAGLGAGLFWYLTRPTEQAPEWPSRKKVRKEKRREEAARRAQAAAQTPPGEVHVEKDATTDLKVPLGEVIS